MKRIIEVSLVSILETQPDLSWIGEYTDKPSDWVIVRQDGDYLYNLNLRADKQAYEDYKLEQERMSFGRKHTVDDFATWQEYYGIGYELPSRGRDFRFFKPEAGGEKEGSADYQKYGLQDFERMESYNRGNWHMLGLQAVAKIQTRKDENSDWLCNEISSSSLWGIESDCGEEYRKEVFDSQLAELRDALKAFGFNDRQITQAFEKAVEKDGGYDC